MESFRHLNNPLETTNTKPTNAEFIPDVTNIVNYLQRQNYVDLAVFFNNEFKNLKKLSLSENNLRFLDELGKFRFH